MARLWQDMTEGERILEAARLVGEPLENTDATIQFRRCAACGVYIPDDANGLCNLCLADAVHMAKEKKRGMWG